jgi:hypothetical protein
MILDATYHKDSTTTEVGDLSIYYGYDESNRNRNRNDKNRINHHEMNKYWVSGMRM